MAPSETANGRVSLAAVGDLFLGALPDNVLDKVIPVLREHDLRFCVLEGPVSDRGTDQPGKSSIHRSGASTMATVKNAGFDVVTLANNHIMDLQTEAFYDTMDLLDQHKIAYFGAGKDIHAARKSLIIDCKGCRIGFVGYASFYHPGSQATESRPGIAQVRVNPLYPSPHIVVEDLDNVLANIAETKAQSDVVVAAFHWGISHSRSLTEDQMALARRSVEAGADLVLGGHPHILQGIEVYQGKVISYCLGNFVFEWVHSFGNAPTNHTVRETGLLTCLIEDRALKGVYFRPVAINSAGGHKLAEPEIVPPGSPQFTQIANTMVDLSAKLNTTLRVEGDKVWVLGL